MAYQVKLPVFEGPFDLLFHLIQKQEIDIWSISITEITDQYLEYLRAMEELNLEIASEFLVMAAALLRLKSKRLLPSSSSFWEEEDDKEILSIDSTEDLIRKVLEYRLFKEAAFFLREREKEQKKIFFRSSRQPRVYRQTRQETIWDESQEPEKLARLFQQLQERELKENTRLSFTVTEEYGLRQKMKYITDRLKRSKSPLYFSSLLQSHSVEEIIITFFALLELCNQSEARVWQEKKFGPILIEVKEA